jgi:hypothetical protein
LTDEQFPSGSQIADEQVAIEQRRVGFQRKKRWARRVRPEHREEVGIRGERQSNQNVKEPEGERDESREEDSKDMEMSRQDSGHSSAQTPGGPEGVGQNAGSEIRRQIDEQFPEEVELVGGSG